jgi:ABC-type amino acid transport substrate-binding protein
MGSKRLGRWIPVVIGLILVGFLTSGVHAAGDLEKIKAKGTLVVGVKHQVPPFGFLDTETGKLAGFDVDLA